MATYRIKRYSDAMAPQQESHALRNTLLGIGGTAAAFYGARKGMFGGAAMQYSNQGWSKLGQMFGSKGMVKAGVEGQARGMSIRAKGFDQMAARDQARLLAKNKSEILSKDAELNSLYKQNFKKYDPTKVKQQSEESLKNLDLKTQEYRAERLRLEAQLAANGGNTVTPNTPPAAPQQQ